MCINTCQILGCIYLFLLYMVFFKVNNKDTHVAFFFNAFFTAVTFAVILVFNDFVDDYLRSVHTTRFSKHLMKGSIHALFILFFTLFVTYFFHFTFGWGNSMIG
jgi:hypothetical protein